MHRCLIGIALVSAFTMSLAQDKPVERKSTLTGHIIDVRDFHSTILGNTRNLTIYLPPDYEKAPRRRYPVLYLNDGQNVFNGLISNVPNQEWRLDEAAEGLANAGLIEPIIMVAIDNGGMARGDEYLPTPFKMSPTSAPIGGKADLYGRMLIEEIKPMIDKQYRTKRGPNDTGILGSSFGGVISLYLGLTRSESIAKVAALSPSIWVNNREMVKQIEAMPKKVPVKIWIDMGSGEGYTSVPDTKAAAAALASKGWQYGKDMVLYIDGYAEHNEISWARRVPAILMWLFGKK